MELFLRRAWEFFFGNPLPAGFTNRGSAGWGVAQAIVLLFIFKYWNFFARLVWFRAPEQHYWANAFLWLGVWFLRFEFIRYATDRCKSKTEAGNVGEYLAFILFFPTMVAGPIKRYQEFLPELRSEPSPWPNGWHRGVTRILAGLAKSLPSRMRFGLREPLESCGPGSGEPCHVAGVPAGVRNQDLHGFATARRIVRKCESAEFVWQLTAGIAGNLYKRGSFVCSLMV